MIDSIGFKDEKVWIDENANPHSDALHVVERWTRPDLDHIHVDTLIEDPKFYTRPFTYARTWVLGKPDERSAGILLQREQRRPGSPRLRSRPDPADGTRGYDNLAPLPPPIPESTGAAEIVRTSDATTHRWLTARRRRGTAEIIARAARGHR